MCPHHIAISSKAWMSENRSFPPALLCLLPRHVFSTPVRKWPNTEGLPSFLLPRKFSIKRLTQCWQRNTQQACAERITLHPLILLSAYCMCQTHDVLESFHPPWEGGPVIIPSHRWENQDFKHKRTACSVCNWYKWHGTKLTRKSSEIRHVFVSFCW